MIGICEFCGQEKEISDGCSFHGSYCADCIQMAIDLDRQILKEMRLTGRKQMMETGTTGTCDFCGQEKVLADGNGFHGCYCADCIKLNIEENQELLKTMGSKKKRKKSDSGTEIEEAKKELDEAFAKLLDGSKVYCRR